MLEKLIEDLKKKLSGQKKSDDTENQEELSEESGETENSEEAKPDAKDVKKLPINKDNNYFSSRLLGFDFLMPKEEAENIDQFIQKPVSRKRSFQKTEAEANTPSSTPETIGTTSEMAPTEAVDGQVAEVKNDEVKIEEPKSSDEELSKAITEVSNETKSENSSNADLTSAPVEEINILKNTESAEASTSLGLGEGSQDSKQEDSKPSSLESKITEQSVYVEPPNYESNGRGLVYNCKGKYWACLDKTSYQTCHKNMKFNSENGKSSECVTQNVYANEEDCNTIQKFNVSTNVATSFCK